MLVYELGRFYLVDRKVDLAGGDWPQMLPDKIIYVDSPGIIDLGGGWQLQVERLTMSEMIFRMAQTNQDPYQAWLAADPEQDSIFLRTPRPGDRIQPLGMVSGTQKLSDFMINHKIPRWARSGWPLVCVGEKIAWVPGYRLGQDFQLQTTSRQVVHFTLKKSDSPDLIT